MLGHKDSWDRLKDPSFCWADMPCHNSCVSGCTSISKNHSWTQLHVHSRKKLWSPICSYSTYIRQRRKSKYIAQTSKYGVACEGNMTPMNVERQKAHVDKGDIATSLKQGLCPNILLRCLPLVVLVYLNSFVVKPSQINKRNSKKVRFLENIFAS